MSTGAALTFIQLSNGEWYYTLAGGAQDAAYTSATFSTFDDANKHCKRHHANPGGATIRKYTN